MRFPYGFGAAGLGLSVRILASLPRHAPAAEEGWGESPKSNSKVQGFGVFNLLWRKHVRSKNHEQRKNCSSEWLLATIELSPIYNTHLASDWSHSVKVRKSLLHG